MYGETIKLYRLMLQYKKLNWISEREFYNFGHSEVYRTRGAFVKSTQKLINMFKENMKHKVSFIKDMDISITADGNLYISIDKLNKKYPELMNKVKLGISECFISPYSNYKVEELIDLLITIDSKIPKTSNVKVVLELVNKFTVSDVSVLTKENIDTYVKSLFTEDCDYIIKEVFNETLQENIDIK